MTRPGLISPARVRSRRTIYCPKGEGEPYIAYGLSPFLRPVGNLIPAFESARWTVLSDTANSTAAS